MEYMTVDEYDAFLDDPADFLIRTYLPRISGTMAPLAMLPPIPTILPYYLGLTILFGAASAMGVSSALESLIKALKEFGKLSENARRFSAEMKSLGFPVVLGSAMSHAPFDTIGDSLRGTRGIMLDMYRNPDKLQKAMEKLLPFAVQMGIFSGRASTSPMVFIPLHKGSMGFMSIDQFRTFYWPTLHQLILALIDEGLVPMVLIESDYTDRLEIIKDIPIGKAIYWFERTDIFRAKKVLGDRVCIKGNIPSSLMCTGTPEDVEAYCKKLIEVVGRNGGLIVDGDIGIPDEARVENVRAMTDFVREFGVYT
jgi:uroporphyrinogen-III decarboxylase